VVIYIGIDDTDMPDTPGTNQLARHLVRRVAPKWRGRLITRHQLLEDPRVPCTRRNGCVAIAFDAPEAMPGELGKAAVDALVADICTLMGAWCPAGSDPGICAATDEIPGEVIEFGRECQHSLVTQRQARELAARHHIRLQGLGGTEDGVIGALAAVGLQRTGDDGRVIYVGRSEIDHYDISGVHPIERLSRFGIDEVRRIDDRQLVTAGTVALGKRLRPNLREGKVVLFVSPYRQSGVDWNAERVV